MPKIHEKYIKRERSLLNHCRVKHSFCSFQLLVDLHCRGPQVNIPGKQKD